MQPLRLFPVAIKISKFHTFADIKPGGIIDYQIKIENIATYPVFNITIWDTLPEKVKYITHLEGITPSVSSDNKFLLWDYSGYTLNPGETLSVKFRVEILDLKFSEYIANTGVADYNDQYYITERHPPVFSRISYIIYNNKIVVFSNPVKTGGTLKFANLPVGSYVHIFTISGEFVTGLEAKTPVITRDTKNRFGCICSPGVYYYIIYSKFMDEVLQKGKLFIINQ